MRIIAMIQARSTSKRFPNKMGQLLGTRSLLRCCIDRAEKLQVDDVVILMPWSDERIFGMRAGSTRVVLGDEDDVSQRFGAAIQQYRPDAVVRICGDAPLFDIYQATRVVSNLKNGQFYTTIAPNGTLAPLTCYGVFVEGFSVDAYVSAVEKGAYKDPVNQEHVTSAFYRSGEWPIFAPSIQIDKPFSLSIDTPEDLHRANAVLDLSGEQFPSLEKIIEVLDLHPDLRGPDPIKHYEWMI